MDFTPSGKWPTRVHPYTQDPAYNVQAQSQNCGYSANIVFKQALALPVEATPDDDALVDDEDEAPRVVPYERTLPVPVLLDLRCISLFESLLLPLSKAISVTLYASARSDVLGEFSIPKDSEYHLHECRDFWHDRGPVMVCNEQLRMELKGAIAAEFLQQQRSSAVLVARDARGQTICVCTVHCGQKD